ncbi:MAG TPA: mechanosensitive ion channel domain-containing protein, partial [Acetobacteraceae bacterium]|nr:mechanosensitive ion channel domain-containing protein [Acetobacteraceae bacterium]
PAPRPAPPAPARPAATPAAPASAPALTAAEAARLADLLRDDARRAELLRTLEALSAAGRAAPTAPAAPGATPPATPAQPAATPPAATPPATTPTAPEQTLLAPDTLGAQLLMGASQRLSALSDQLVAAAQAITDIPALISWFSGVARDPVTQARALDAAWKLVLLFGLGLLAEWLVWRALRGWRDRLDASAPVNGSAFKWLQRIPLVLGRLVLDLLPLLAFAVVSYGLIGAVRPFPTTELFLLTANNAYLASRALMSAFRMLLSPASAHLRLVPVTDETAAYITVWLRRITIVLVTGYASAEAGLLFGLPWSIYDAIMRVCLLIVTLFLVIIILQNRQAVAELLRAPVLESGDEPDRMRRSLRLLRDRAAEVWHLIAIAWLIAAWGVWALEVREGFPRLLRVSALTIVIVGLAKLAEMLLRRGIDRAFRISPELHGRFPGLEARANRYLPVLRGVVTFIVSALALLFLLEAWGIEAFAWFGAGKLGNRLVGSIVSIALTLALAIVVWEAANAAIQRHLQKLSRDAQAARSARVRTLLPMLRTALLVVILIFVALNVLTEIGVNVAPLIAGAGVVGLAIGFGSQTLVRDVITGIFLLFEDAVAVGDVVTVGGMTGVVEQLSIRSIRLRATDGSVHIIPFSAVSTVTNMTRDYAFAVLDVTVTYGEDTDRVGETLKAIACGMREEPRWSTAIRDDLDLMGVEKMSETGVTVRARLKTEPGQRWAVARELNRRVRERFAELGIAVAAQPFAAGAPLPPPAPAEPKAA